MKTICLAPTPMPYLTDCRLKQFGRNEFHCSRYCEYFVLIFMLKNTLTFTENQEPVSLQAGERYIQSKNTWQAASRPSPNAEYYYIHFQAEYTRDLTNRLKFPVRGTFQTELFLPILARLCTLAHQTPADHLELQGEFLRLLGMLYTQEQSYSALTVSLMRYLNENFSLPITARALSEQFHYSSEYLDRRMRRETGLTPHAYLTVIRLQNAKKLLERTELPVQKIGQECGFSDNSVFYRAFRKKFGMGPGAWRRKHQPQAEISSVSPLS